MSGRCGRFAARLWRRDFLPLGLAALLACSALTGLAAVKGKQQLPATPLDLNSASAEQLIALPGIGPVTAKAILRFREESGPFERVDDLLAIRGISRRKLARLRPYVTVKPIRHHHSAKQADKSQSARAAASRGAGNTAKKH